MGDFLKNKDLDLPAKISTEIGFFRFKKIDKDYLLTNDIGKHIFLSPIEYQKFISGSIREKTSLYQALRAKNFLKESFEKVEFIEKYAAKNKFFFQRGPSLHIIVATLRCNHNCVYCQTSSCGEKENGRDLSAENAKKIIDFIFSTPNQNISIEFQGGEPLLNWPVVKTTIEYVKKKNSQDKKNIDIRLVSNFSLMTQEIADYLLRQKVVVCTSVDGPEKVHNKNRFWHKGNSQKTAAKWLKYFLKRYSQHYIFQPGALLTITKSALPYWKEIVDEYVKIGVDTIALRPLAQLGIAQKSWKVIGYKSTDFLKFYRNALDYIFELNLKKRIFFREALTATIAVKIFSDRTPNFFELRSPCGAGIGQLLYNYNGDIYTCDEGRMTGKDTFKLGDISMSYGEIANNPIIKTMCLASCLETLNCDHCVYKPYCGTCPILSYAESGNIFPQLPNNSRCQIHSGIFEYLFKKIKKDNKIKEVLENWINRPTK